MNYVKKGSKPDGLLPFLKYLSKFLFFLLSLDSEFFADILRDGILVYHEVHSLVCYECLGHVPGSLVIAILTP